MNSNPERGVKGNILIVDDTPDNLRLLSSILSEQGYKVRSALHGEMALMGVKASPPDLILLDINMPNMNGYEVCSCLKGMEETRQIPVIFMSALGEVGDKVKGFRAGGVDYITKPFQLEEVLARIETHLTIQNLASQLTEQNARLKQEVSDRLQAEQAQREKSQQLTQALQQLKQAQTRLVHSEKMSSLGNLVAGIAHEINNPVNFIYGNLIYAAKHTQDLLTLMQLYQQYLPNPPAELRETIENTDLEFIESDLPKLMDSMKVGAKRIAEIVESLRCFSRHNEAEIKEVDIHEGLDSTLMILQHRLRDTSAHPAIEVIREYGSLPKVECYARQINQVFMNILTNAIDALLSRCANPTFGENQKREVNKGEEPIINLQAWTPRIVIRTEALEPDGVTIRIADNGPGISEEVKSQLFDPFFTTKTVGEGTGLGLSISYQIIKEQHGGSLQCYSQLGQGAEFVLQIPLRPLIQL
ncbi:response regulator [Microcoleus sp. ZQ-A2]|nr:response regulator [Microcoleus sp. FACHB-1]